MLTMYYKARLILQFYTDKEYRVCQKWLPSFSLLCCC